MMTRDLPDLPVALLDRALIEGERLAFGADDLERQVLRAADRVRAGRRLDGHRGRRPTRPGSCRWYSRAAPAGRPPTARRPTGCVSFGPSGVGGFVRVALDPARVPAGPSVAPLAVAAFALADERFGTGIGPLEPARAVR